MADALSRKLKKLTSEDEEEDQISLPILAVNCISGNYQQYPDKLVIDQIREETSKGATITFADKVHQKWMATDWKETSKGIAPLLELSRWTFIEDGVLLKLYRILIPYTLWLEMLDLIHEGHQGVEKCLLSSRESLFWAGISSEICQNSRQMWNLSSYIHSTEETSQGSKWNSTTCLAHPRHWFVLLETFCFLSPRDYFSKFLIVRKLPSSTSSAVCKEISNIFMEFGIPYLIRSDNGPCYASKAFKGLMELFQVQHVPGSPHFPQSNDLAGLRHGEIAKKLMDCSIYKRNHGTLVSWNTDVLQLHTREHSFTIGASNWFENPEEVFLLYYKIIQPQGNIMKISSRSSKWIFLRNFAFQPISQDKQFGVLIHSTRYGSPLWF